MTDQQDKNKFNDSTRPVDMYRSVADYFNTLAGNFDLSNRESKLLSESLKNIEANRIINEKQSLINAANQDIPVLLTSQARLGVLEALLVARARDGKPVDDLVKAIACDRTPNIQSLNSGSSKNSSFTNSRGRVQPID